MHTRNMKIIATTLILAFYILFMIVDRSAGNIYIGILALSLAALSSKTNPEGVPFVRFVKQNWPIMLAMSGMLIAVLANQLITQHIAYRAYDRPIRLAVFVFIFWLFSFVPLHYMRLVPWAMAIGALASAIKIYILTDGGVLRYGTDFIPIIIFSEIALLLGFFSVLSLRWNKVNSKIEIAIKLVALFGGLYSTYLSQSRGAWMTIPVLAAIVFLISRQIQLRHKISTIVLFVILLGSVAYFGNIVQNRLMGAKSDITQFEDGKDLDTSLGTRLQLWHGSWVLFIEHPLVGIGAGKNDFPDALDDLVKRKIITPISATFPHSHNEILFTISRLGLFGLFAILGLYFVPMYYFLRELRHQDIQVRYTAGMGTGLICSFIILGLVDVLFLWWEIFPFYTLSIALFLTFIRKRKLALTESSSVANSRGTLINSVE